jgi:hypothetical protein
MKKRPPLIRCAKDHPNTSAVFSHSLLYLVKLSDRSPLGGNEPGSALIDLDWVGLKHIRGIFLNAKSLCPAVAEKQRRDVAACRAFASARNRLPGCSIPDSYVK